MSGLRPCRVHTEEDNLLTAMCCPIRGEQQMAVEGEEEMKMGKSLIVVGGQYGSEGKGSYIDHIAADYPVHVRTGGPQAGHSVKLPDGQVLKFQVVPVGALQPTTAASVIAMASVFDPVQFELEMGWVRDRLGRWPTVLIDPRATLLDSGHVADEAEKGINARLGSTAHGVGAARADRIWRTAGTVGDGFDPGLWEGAVRFEDTARWLRQKTTYGVPVLVETAQGYELSLFHAAHYPYCTSAECTPAQALSDMGLTLREAAQFTVRAIYRTTPIRVHGNSGPLPYETSWDNLRAQWGPHIPTEQTTVTRRTRRVGRWDPQQARHSAEALGADDAVITFLDYPFPRCAGQTDWQQLQPEAVGWVKAAAADLGCPVVSVATGFGTYADIPGGLRVSR